MDRLSGPVGAIGQAAVTQILGEQNCIAGLHRQPDHARFLVRISALIRRFHVALMRCRHNAKRPVVRPDVMYEIDHPHHHAVDPRLVIGVHMLYANRPAHMRAGLVAGVADTDFRVVDRRPPLNDGVDVGHRRRMIHQHVKFGVGVEKVFDHQRIPRFPGAVGIVASLDVVMILKSAYGACPARRLRHARSRLVLQRVNDRRQVSDLILRQQPGNRQISQTIKFVLLDFVHISLHSPVVKRIVGCHPLQTSCLTRPWKTGRRFPTQVQPTAYLQQRPAGQVEVDGCREGKMSGITVPDPQPRRQRPLESVTVHPHIQQRSLGAVLIDLVHAHARGAPTPRSDIKDKTEAKALLISKCQVARSGRLPIMVTSRLPPIKERSSY